MLDRFLSQTNTHLAGRWLGWGAPLVLIGIILLLSAGCADAPQFRINAVHMRTVEKEFLDDERMPGPHVEQLNNVMKALFGTPDDPHFPPAAADKAAVVDLTLLQRAAGPVSVNELGHGQGLYRQHCAHCHGVTGDGSGPTAAYLNPYPRDFRLGKFKFKSTALYHPPTADDLQRVIRRGIAGTSMPSFELLSEADIDSVAEYVKYLSIRGQVERKLIEDLSAVEPDEDLISRPGTVDDDEFEYQVQLIMKEVIEPILKDWRNAEDDIVVVPDEPAAFARSRIGLAQFGKSLFHGKANCTQCHGVSGLGDGQLENYDDWTNEWLKRSNVNPDVASEVDEFVSLGAHPPRKLRPRNLRHRVFRGGSTAADLYRRIKAGIEGTSMPAAPNLSEEEVWALVAYVLEFPYLRSAPVEE
ncbi:MAG: c-type cytochrome [Pirellulaceae bacterium]